MFTDPDSSWANSGAALNQYNRRPEKALSMHDRGHLICMQVPP